jgi:putative PIN family toxin of toxin-antitoxin system
MRAVVDTYVLVSGLLCHGAPHLRFGLIHSGTLSLVSSPALLAELESLIHPSKFQATLYTSPDHILMEIRQLAEIVDPLPLRMPASRDPDDDAVLALAEATQADLIVSGDADLLTLGCYQGNVITTPTKTLALVAAADVSG